MFLIKTSKASCLKNHAAFKCKTLKYSFGLAMNGLNFMSFKSSQLYIFFLLCQNNWAFRCSHPEVFLGKGVLKICTKFTGEHPCQKAIIEIVLWHGCSPVNLLHIFGTYFLKNTSWRLLLSFPRKILNVDSYIYFCG